MSGANLAAVNAEKAEWFRREYGIDARVGRRVLFEGHQGTIVGYSSSHLQILLDGEREPGIYHPIWHIAYIDDVTREATR